MHIRHELEEGMGVLAHQAVEAENMQASIVHAVLNAQ